MGALQEVIYQYTPPRFPWHFVFNFIHVSEHTPEAPAQQFRRSIVNRTGPAQLNVCHIISGDLWAGAECQVVNLLSGLSKNMRFRVSAITFNPGKLTEELRKLRVAVTCLSEKKLSPLKIFLGTTKHIREHEVRIIHCHGHKEHIIGCAATLFSGNRPKVVRTMHGLPEPHRGIAKTRAVFFGRLQDFFKRNFTQKIIVVSHDMERRLLGKSWAGKMICIHNGVDVSRLSVTVPREEMRRVLCIGKENFVMGIACRLVTVKRVDFLLDAFKAIYEDYPEAFLLISGDGPLLSALKLQAKNLGILPRVRFLGHRDDIYNVMSALDLFVMTSEHEGIPMVLLEALALGIPVLAPNVGGIPEIVQGTRATLFEPLSLLSFTARLTAEMERASPETANRVPEGLVFNRLSSDRTTAETARLYEELVANEC